MPEIRMTKLSVSPDGARHPGKTYEVTAEEGRALVDGDAAVWITRPIVESAVITAPETAVGAGQRARGKPRPPVTG